MYKSLPLESLALNQPVPVNIWDPKGVLLLRKGEPITSEQHRSHLMLHTPMVLAADWQAWGYSYTAALDRMVRGNESLGSTNPRPATSLPPPRPGPTFTPHSTPCCTKAPRPAISRSAWSA